jgi:hypothetical protein
MDWQLNQRLQQWEVTTGAWRAVVAQLHSGEWYPYVQRIEPPHDRYDGPSCEGALEGRAWCKAKLTELVGGKTTPGGTM